MYFPDLSACFKETWSSMYAVGWLDLAHPYPQSEVPGEVIERLAAFCAEPPVCTMGFHECEFCDTSQGAIPARLNEKSHWLGSCMIFVFGPDGRAYNAPDLIYHYVTEHRYQPPQAFITALMQCPMPDTPEYQALVKAVRIGRAA